MDLKNPTRTESLLANIAGYTDVPVPDMKNATRSERLLKEILDNGGGGGGDVTKEYVDTAIADAVAELQITQSDTLTLTVAGWSNNTQTVTYAHDTSKRNSIDVEPANIKAWTAAGILATAETASTITFECDTVPTADLSFRITSMEVR